MKFFLPEWDDRVDPGYDFITDRPTLQRDPYRDDLYAHELFFEPVYDGLLLSRMALDGARTKQERIYQVGAKAYLRMPESLELFGDCGAFGYVSEPDPIYTSEEIARYYQDLGFDYGVSVDHIILPEFAEQRQYRYDLTLRNADELIQLHRSGGFTFTPVGAVQGWDPDTYAAAACQLVDMGYDYIAMGGLARSNTREVTELVTRVAQAVEGRTRIHVLGVARASLLPLFVQLGITSADSAAPLRQAWLAAKDNYYTPDGAYAAIRIPMTQDDRGRPTTLVGRSNTTFKDLREAEQEALTAVRQYAQRKRKLDETLAAIVAYDTLLADRVDERNATARHRLYRETLKARPWERCRCPICESIGIEVLIFRGNNRNRRRGFHNLWTLRRRIETAAGSRRDLQSLHHTTRAASVLSHD